MTPSEHSSPALNSLPFFFFFLFNYICPLLITHYISLLNMLICWLLLVSSCLWISILASRWVSKGCTMTKSHGAVDRDLRTPGSLSFQDSLKCLYTPSLYSLTHLSSASSERIKTGMMCVCVWGGVKPTKCNILNGIRSWLLNGGMPWHAYCMCVRRDKLKIRQRHRDP